MLRRPPGSTRLPYTPLFRSLPATVRAFVDALALATQTPAALAALMTLAALATAAAKRVAVVLDRKSTRLNSSHANISYAVFCLKKQKALPLLLVLTSAPATS